MVRRFRRPRRGVSPIIGTILLLTITVIFAAVLAAFRPPLPSAWFSLGWEASGVGSEGTWGDGTDCTEVNGVQSCLVLPAIDIVFPNPPAGVEVSQLELFFLCNNTVYLNATFAQLEWVPGSTGTVTGGPQLGECGSGFVPPRASWNRLVFFQQINPGYAFLEAEDTLVLYAHTFTTWTDEDFHGAPLWCYTIPGACEILIYYIGSSPPPLVAAIPLLGMY